MSRDTYRMLSEYLAGIVYAAVFIIGFQSFLLRVFSGVEVLRLLFETGAQTIGQRSFFFAEIKSLWM